MVNSQHFIFSAQGANPLRGGYRMLTSPYDVTVTKDSLISYLPYFGRAYSTPYNPSEPTLSFTSTSFSYSVTQHKKNEWVVIVKPKDNKEIQQYLFMIYDNGSATLNVTFNPRDPITLNGFLKQIIKISMDLKGNEQSYCYFSVRYGSANREVYYYCGNNHCNYRNNHLFLPWLF